MTQRMGERPASELVSKGPCDKCGSKDNKATYDDGHSYCFTPGCGYEGDSEVEIYSSSLQEGVIRALEARKLDYETCKRWDYRCDGDTQIANYKDERGNIVAQKIRKRNKSFSISGDAKQMSLYGKWLCRGSGRRIIITEGELDALSVSQVLQHKWPVVSLPHGAATGKKVISKELDFLSNFEEVVLCFDQDEAGQHAVTECAGLFPPGKAYITTLPCKDPNECLQKGRIDELVSALWGAKPYRPDGIIRATDLVGAVLESPTRGTPWFIGRLDEATYGRRYGECVALGAGTGVGKTTFVTQQIASDLSAGHKVAVFALEQLPAETIKRVAGMIDGVQYHVPDTEYDQDKLRSTVASLSNLYLYDHFGATDWDIIRNRIRYMAHADGVRIFYLDHLTALAAQADDERRALESIMADIGKLVKELDIWMLFVSHLATPDGKPHEEGGRVMARHFKGSRSIAYWSHFMLGIERDQQGHDRTSSCLRVLKDRYTGKGTGLVIQLDYDHGTGRFVQPFEKVDF